MVGFLDFFPFKVFGSPIKFPQPILILNHDSTNFEYSLNIFLQRFFLKHTTCNLVHENAALNSLKGTYYRTKREGGKSVYNPSVRTSHTIAYVFEISLKNSGSIKKTAKNIFQNLGSTIFWGGARHQKSENNESSVKKEQEQKPTTQADNKQ